MTDKELIKQEIERLKHNTPNAYDLSRFMLLEEIESFIDSIPEEHNDDLEEEIDRFAKTVVPSRSKTITRKNLFLCAKHFAEWQKQQMMKDAVDGEVVYSVGTALEKQYKVISERVTMNGIKLGDKVKIIIIKED